MSTLQLIFPHQLFLPSPLSTSYPVLLIEDRLFFGDDKGIGSFHFQKLLLHRASMQIYFKTLKQEGFDITYIPYSQADWKDICSTYGSSEVEEVIVVDPHDEWALKRVTAAFEAADIPVTVLNSPGFFNSRDYNADYFSNHSWNQTSFYIQQRKRLDILIADNKPIGGSWTFDAENRKALPKDHDLPVEAFEKYDDSSILDAQKYLRKNFDVLGADGPLMYPYTHDQAKSLLHAFLSIRFAHFGDYQDALTTRSQSIYHSLISSSLNIGLLTPNQVLEMALNYTADHTVSLNSVEGFLRQILGWREYMRAVYDIKGVELRNSNFFEFSRALPYQFYNGSTGVKPVDDVIGRILETGYAHHIERLMVLGNFMLLCEIHPDKVYWWFMELFVDSYDWVMVGNVYGMSQYADGGNMVTKPYISSSSYIKKMSDYPTGDWCELWDALYWRFLDTHRNKLEDNPRMKLMYHLLDKKDRNELSEQINIAEEYLKTLD